MLILLAFFFGYKFAVTLFPHADYNNMLANITQIYKNIHRMKIITIIQITQNCRIQCCCLSMLWLTWLCICSLPLCVYFFVIWKKNPSTKRWKWFSLTEKCWWQFYIWITNVCGIVRSKSSFSLISSSDCFVCHYFFFIHSYASIFGLSYCFILDVASLLNNLYVFEIRVVCFV